jgi:hypothetical protein
VSQTTATATVTATATSQQLILDAIRIEREKLEQLQKIQALAKQEKDTEMRSTFPKYWTLATKSLNTSLTETQYHKLEDSSNSVIDNLNSSNSVIDNLNSSNSVIDNLNSSNSVIDIIRELCKKTTIQAHIGKGRDNLGLSHSSYEIKTVYRIENPTMYMKYHQHKNTVRNEMNSDHQVPSYDTTNNTRLLENVSVFSLDDSVNEMYLWHGTKPTIKDIIPMTGFDERVASQGLFGNGIYFAENFSKSDEYVTPDTNGVCYMFLTRVCMGNIAHIKKEQSSRKRPPCIKEITLTGDAGRCNGLCSHPRYHSLLAEKGDNCFLKKYREFIVYDRNQCYPEYLIEFKRIK